MKSSRSARSSAQRMLPLAEKLVPKVQEMMPPEVEQDEDLFNPALLLSAGKDAPEKEVRAILVDSQWERWKKACVPPTNQEGQAFGDIPGLVAPAAARRHAPAKSAAAAGREPVELTLSKFMAAQAVMQRQRQLAPLFLQIEEAARVARPFAGSLRPAADRRARRGGEIAAEMGAAIPAVRPEQCPGDHGGERLAAARPPGESRSFSSRPSPACGSRASLKSACRRS